MKSIEFISEKKIDRIPSDIIPEIDLGKPENKKILDEILTYLTQQERDLITAVYFNNMSVYAHAKETGFSSTRGKQVHEKALRKIQMAYHKILRGPLPSASASLSAKSIGE